MQLKHWLGTIHRRDGRMAIRPYARCHHRFSGMLSGMGAAIALSTTIPALAQSPTDPIRPPQQCPSDLEQLVPLMVRDLPSYTNRVLQRSFPGDRVSGTPGVIIIAGVPEYGSLSLGPGIYEPTDADTEPDQVFFTTLERQYIRNRTGVLLQGYHWAFLVRANDQWRLALLFSGEGDYLTQNPPAPPNDTSYGAIAQAIRLWLRDCEAGTIPPIQAS